MSDTLHLTTDMDSRFHLAQYALAEGDVEGMTRLLATDPTLATAKSERSHPTLMQCLVLYSPPTDSIERLIDLLADYGSEVTDPLIAAASMGNVRAVAKLLDRGADIEGNGLWSPLEEALYWNHANSVALLLERGAKVRNLRTAAALEDWPYFERCFNADGSLTPEAGEIAWPFFHHAIPESVRRDPQQILTNALVYAAAWGRIEAVHRLLARGAQINQIPPGFDYAGTALHYAALEGHRAMVDHLLAKGADPALPDAKIGTLPENWAAHGGHKALSEHLRCVRKRGA